MANKIFKKNQITCLFLSLIDRETLVYYTYLLVLKFLEIGNKNIYEICYSVNNNSYPGQGQSMAAVLPKFSDELTLLCDIDFCHFYWISS